MILTGRAENVFAWLPSLDIFFFPNNRNELPMMCETVCGPVRFSSPLGADR